MAELKDSGNRRDFGTGAVRDVAEGKGRMDLLPLKQIVELIESCKSDKYIYSNRFEDIYGLVNDFILYRRKESLYYAICQFSKLKGWDIETLIIEVSIHYEDGARKYSDRNWENGIPLHCFIDSGLRHYTKWLRGDDDEPHDRAFVWNMLGAIWTLDNHLELDDLPPIHKGSISDTFVETKEKAL